MADVAVTPANVIAAAGAIVDRTRNAGGTILAGQTVYLDAATKKWTLSDANAAAVAAHAVSGFALHGASLNQPLAVCTDGDVNVGGVLVPGVVYCQSNTPGGITANANLVTGDFVTIVGIATTASNLRIGINASGVAI